MTDTLPRPTEQDLTGHYAKVSAHVSEPWQALPAFQMMREAAKLNGFPDIEDIRISVEVTFYGHTPEANIEALKTKLDDTWLGADVFTTPRYRSEATE